MVITDDIELPSEEDLTVDEIKLSGPVLKAAAFHVGKKCEDVNNEFVLCREELKDPRACLAEGKAVTACALEFFRAIKRACSDEFMQYARCLDKSSPDQQFTPCRKTQAVYDKCVSDKLELERPPYDYFTRVHVHHAKRDKQEKEKMPEYPDASPKLPDDAPKPDAKYGSRSYMGNW